MNSEVTSAAAVKLLQSCLTLCNPTEGTPPGSPVPGIFQARTLEWVPISFSNAWKWKMKLKQLSHVRLFTTLWTAAYQAPQSTEFSRQEYWSGLPLPSLEVTEPYIYMYPFDILGCSQNKVYFEKFFNYYFIGKHCTFCIWDFICSF